MVVENKASFRDTSGNLLSNTAGMGMGIHLGITHMGASVFRDGFRRELPILCNPFQSPEFCHYFSPSHIIGAAIHLVPPPNGTIFHKLSTIALLVSFHHRYKGTTPFHSNSVYEQLNNHKRLNDTICQSQALRYQDEANESVACAFYNETTFRWSTAGVRRQRVAGAGVRSRTSADSHGKASGTFFFSRRP